MQRTIDFLDAVKARHSLVSDYQLAPFLGVTRSCVSRMRVGKDYLGEKTALRVAEALEIEWSYVVACANAERAKDPLMKAKWASMAEKVASMAATVILGIAAYTMPLPQAQASTSLVPVNVYYVKSRRRNAKRTLLD